MYYTYILYSRKILKYYVGQTIDLERRILEHNTGKTSFMKTGTLWLLIKAFEFETQKEAVELEKKIKKSGAKRFLDDIGYG